MKLLQSLPDQFRSKLPPPGEMRRGAQIAAFLLVMFILLYIAGTFMPEGFDWGWAFSKGIIPSLWVPWTKALVSVLNYPTIFAITILSMAIRALRYRNSPLALALGLISLPTLWMFHLGNLDGISILGLVLLPWGAPLVLLKPQIASFALLANRKSIIVAIAWLLISFLIWGFWPLTWLPLLTNQWSVEWPQDIALFPWGLLIALPLMWFSRGDEDLLMAAGSFATPHLFPYHFIVLMPALARMRIPMMLLTWFISWTPLLSNWLGPWAWHFGNLMSVCFWAGIYFNRKDPVRLKREAARRASLEQAA
jgi:hypothetical protein